MDAAGDRAETRMERPKGSAGKGSSRARGDSRPGSSDSPGRPLEETRRKRPPAQRYTGWNDGIERAYCTRAGHRLPSTFPVASHSGAAVIPPTVVARRPDAMLLCIFDHLGAHVWPDGELVEESSTEEAVLDGNQ